MNSNNFTQNEKGVLVQFYMAYFNKLNESMKRQGSMLFGNNSVLIDMVNEDLRRIKNWIGLEVAAMDYDVSFQPELSSENWGKIDSQNRKEFLKKINEFLLNKDAVIFQNGNSLVKPTSDLVLLGMLNSLNS